MRRVQHVDLVPLLLVVLLLGCDASLATPTPAISPKDSPATPTAPAAPIGIPSPLPADPFLGSLVVTVTDRLRVRSLPEVSDTSTKYEPLLPLGTELRVIGGPVNASGYVWYHVTPVSFILSDGIVHGWVAGADHDGQAWLALADSPITGLEVATSAVARAPANAADASAAAESVTGFGLDLYREMLAEPGLALADKNLVFSPASIALALGMARAGARNETGSQMDAVLHASGRAELEAGLNSLEQALSSRDGAYLDDEGKAHELTLRIANASFAQRGWPIDPAYLDAIASAFGAGLKLLDYAADSEAARKAINAWVSQKTAQRIPELLQPPNVTRDTRLYLVNAIYLKANWVTEFRKDETASRSFTRLDGSKVNVPTMRLGGGQEVPFLEGDGWQATELRYLGPDRTMPLAMILIVPDDLSSFESTMSVRQLGRISSELTRERRRLNESIEYIGNGDMDCGMYPYALDLSMPRFSVGTRAELGMALGTLGMPLAFDPARADFRGIHVPKADGGGIFIKNVIHQANIDVDELGTEAAAATAVGIDTGGCTGPSPSKAIVLALDRPFLFAVRDIETGAILFLGRVVDPGIEG
jgi:serpin B